MNGKRVARVGDLLRKELGRLLHEELRDPRVGFVTLTEVEVAPDLRSAKVYLTTMDDRSREATIVALNHAAPFLQRRLARETGLRYTPTLRFYFDEAFESGLRVESILHTLDLSDAPQEADPQPTSSEAEEL